MKTTCIPAPRARSTSPATTGTVAAASGTSSEPPSLTKSFCMSTTTSAEARGSSTTRSWTGRSGTVTVSGMV
ncbi:MAG TPA: hypothetical protein VK501_04710 [Baekduia sp.]|nr:hypothetical protein [Baekduia sp.]HMJ33198.1 hypothetical protein [Baekduia sp.]